MSEVSMMPAERAWGAEGWGREARAGWASSTPPLMTLDAGAPGTPLTLDKVSRLKGEERC